MDSIKVKDLARLVLKAYTHFGINDSRVRRPWLIEHDQHGAEKAVAQSFHAFNGDSIITMDQIRQRGREIACEDQGALYQAWCGIKEVIEADRLYEENPFKPAKNIHRSIIFAEYLELSERYRYVPRKQATREFRLVMRGFSQDKSDIDALDLQLMIEESEVEVDSLGIKDILLMIYRIHFEEPDPETIDVLEAKEETGKVLEPKKKLDVGQGRKIDAKARLRDIYGDKFELVGEYKGLKSKVTVRCTHCGGEFVRQGRYLLSGERHVKCPYCEEGRTIKNAKENEDFYEALKEVNDLQFSYTVLSIISMLKEAKGMHELPGSVVAVLADLIGIKDDSRELHATIARLQAELKEAKAFKENVRGLLSA